MFTAWIKGLYQQKEVDGGETYWGTGGGSLKATGAVTGEKDSGGVIYPDPVPISELLGDAGGLG